MQFTGPSHPQLAEHTHYLALALMEKFQRSGDPVDIDRAISQVQTAVKFTEDRDANKSLLLSNLGSAFWQRFESIGDLGDMENSISYFREALELTPDGERKDEVLSHARPEPSEAYEPEISISNRM